MDCVWRVKLLEWVTFVAVVDATEKFVVVAGSFEGATWALVICVDPDKLAVMLFLHDVDGGNWTELEGPLVWAHVFNGVEVKTSVITVDAEIETLLTCEDCSVESLTKTLVVGHVVCIEELNVFDDEAITLGNDGADITDNEAETPSVLEEIMEEVTGNMEDLTEVMEDLTEIMAAVMLEDPFAVVIWTITRIIWKISNGECILIPRLASGKRNK